MTNARGIDYLKTTSPVSSILLYAAPALRHRIFGMPVRCLPPGGFPGPHLFGPGTDETFPRRTIHDVQETAIAQ